MIIDEAHSSQGGESSRKMTEALSGKNLSPEEQEKVENEIESSEADEDDAIREAILKRGPQENISIFAFTATQKQRHFRFLGLRIRKGNQNRFTCIRCDRLLKKVSF